MKEFNVESIKGCYLQHKEVDIRAYIEQADEDFAIIYKAKPLDSNEYVEFKREQVIKFRLDSELRYKVKYNNLKWTTDETCDICDDVKPLQVIAMTQCNKIYLEKVCSNDHNEWFCAYFIDSEEQNIKEFCLKRLGLCDTEKCKQFYTKKLEELDD